MVSEKLEKEEHEVMKGMKEGNRNGNRLEGCWIRDWRTDLELGSLFQLNCSCCSGPARRTLDALGPLHALHVPAFGKPSLQTESRKGTPTPALSTTPQRA